jgi:hypothetical protein
LQIRFCWHHVIRDAMIGFCILYSLLPVANCVSSRFSQPDHTFLPTRSIRLYSTTRQRSRALRLPITKGAQRKNKVVKSIAEGRSGEAFQGCRLLSAHVQITTTYYLLPTNYYLLPTSYYLLPAPYLGSTYILPDSIAKT